MARWTGALAAYERIRTELDAELGITPGPELRTVGIPRFIGSRTPGPGAVGGRPS